MSFLRSERAAAGLLLGAAILSLILANTPIGATLMGIRDARIGFDAVGLSLSVGHWISDGLLAIFFFLVAIELKHELTVGELDSVGKAIRPAIAALGGVIVPACVYLAFAANSGQAQGWPVPTATDIAFALGVLAVSGRGLPNRLRVFLLALAVLDDLVAILIIAAFFTSDANLLLLAIAVVTAIAFALLSRLLGRTHNPGWRIPVSVAMVVLGILTWALVHQSGVHATIAGVALGLVMARRPAAKVRHAIEPVSNGIVLPLFAFSAALVTIPPVAVMELSAPFWGILVALPAGKMIGITLGGWVGSFVGRAAHRPKIAFHDLVLVSALGGIGFTVSLLMNDLAFTQSLEITDEGTLAVLLGSGISMVIAAILVSRRSSHYRRQANPRNVAPSR